MKRARKARASDGIEMQIVCDIGADGEADLWIIKNGVKIAKRGRPDSPQARTWVSLEPGYTVRYGKTRRGGGQELLVEYQPVRLQ